MMDILKDPMVVYAIAFVIFLGLVYRYGRVSFLTWIDGEIQKVRHQLDEAKKLRADAEKTLAEYKTKQAAALAEADSLIRNAKEEAARLKSESEVELKASLARHEQQVMERIRIAEAAALMDVRQRAIDLAMDMARNALAAKVQGATASGLIDQAIAEMPTASKAKAA